MPNARATEADSPWQALLGGVTPARFLRLHWQRQHRLIRAAIPHFSGLLTPRQLFALATRDDVESRLVVHKESGWELQRGPLRLRELQAMPPRDWTLLVQGVNLVLPAAESLLRRFSFLPYARLDDVMVSYAAPGGGVGPHFDSYDVFLLQGMGRRRWRVSTQADLALRPRLPLRILRHFRSEHEWVVNAGDMLYLPPRYAHDGVALDPCMTYSIGFRAPGSSELAAAWLDHLRDHLPETIAGYADPALRMTSTPARIGPDMTRQCRRLVRVCLPGAIMPEAEFARFLGTWLTEPKPHIFFVPPEAPLGQRRFAACARRRGLALDPCTQMLYDGARVFTNGECETPAGAAQVVVRRLADRRALDGREVPVPVPSLFFAWYRAGYLHLKGTG